MLARPQVKLEASRQAGLDRDIAQVEQLVAARAARGLPVQHGVGGEERREHDDVAEQEDPEAVADDDALRRRTAPCRRSAPCRGVWDRSACGRQPRSSTRCSRSAHRWPRDPGHAVDARDLLGRNDRPRPGRARRTPRRWQRRRRRPRPPATRYARSARSPSRWRRRRRRSRSASCAASRSPRSRARLRQRACCSARCLIAPIGVLAVTRRAAPRN